MMITPKHLILTLLCNWIIYHYVDHSFPDVPPDLINELISTISLRRQPGLWYAVDYTSFIIKNVPESFDERQLEILLAHEIVFNQLKAKFSRGMLEKEIFLILLEDGKKGPEYLIEKEMSKFFKLQEVQEAQKAIRAVVEELIQENYPIMQLD